jgi:hypothetical protein
MRTTMGPGNSFTVGAFGITLQAGGRMILFGSVVASLNPWRVSGRLFFGLQGKTAMPAAAYVKAASTGVAPGCRRIGPCPLLFASLKPLPSSSTTLALALGAVAAAPGSLRLVISWALPQPRTCMRKARRCAPGLLAQVQKPRPLLCLARAGDYAPPPLVGRCAVRGLFGLMLYMLPGLHRAYAYAPGS